MAAVLAKVGVSYPSPAELSRASPAPTLDGINAQIERYSTFQNFGLLGRGNQKNVFSQLLSLYLNAVIIVAEHRVWTCVNYD